MANHSSKASDIEIVINVLQQAVQQLKQNDHVSAHSLLATANNLLEDLRHDLSRYCQLEERLKQLLG